MNKASNMAKGGMITALSIILLYFSSIMPTNKLSFIVVASFLIPIAIINLNFRTSVIIYSAISLLSLFLLPLKGISILYILFFGAYGFIKFLIEKIRKVPIEIFLKLVYFNIVLVILILLYKQFFATMIDIKYLTTYLVVSIILAQLLFMAYDYLVTLMIQRFSKFKF
ncbi:hypothetical protein [Clostridium grantii]|uniref:Uncharacterized protein n=1 Tax=Clostridium grantii DSM 8605 TaxID=1121316 RepID=A0A1M5V2L3_9CLOT|nr:hypothetical protein [Clostridium grantii]SHH69517.1 hypothetical protein SAMN02745207_02028 [Clostridium grantii DSM 8605]